MDDVDWQGTAQLERRSYLCGHCGRRVGPNTGYLAPGPEGFRIYLCSFCQRPTFFDGDRQFPGAVFGDDLQFLPRLVHEVYDEARRCMSVRAYTAAVLLCRKLLINVAVAHGATKNGSFRFCVNYLFEKGWLPPNALSWVDRIRDLGNEAAHEIELRSEEDARHALTFMAMLLRIVYEFPAKVRPDGDAGESSRPA